MAIDPITGNLYVSNFSAKGLSPTAGVYEYTSNDHGGFNPTPIAFTSNLFDNPLALAVYNGDVYVANFSSVNGTNADGLLEIDPL